MPMVTTNPLKESSTLRNVSKNWQIFFQNFPTPFEAFTLITKLKNNYYFIKKYYRIKSLFISDSDQMSCWRTFLINYLLLTCRVYDVLPSVMWIWITSKIIAFFIVIRFSFSFFSSSWDYFFYSTPSHKVQQDLEQLVAVLIQDPPKTF